MADAVAAFGEFPFDIQVRASDTAGTAFQTAFMVNCDAVAFLTVDVGRAKIEARLFFAFILADFTINYLKMAFLIHFKTVEK